MMVFAEILVMELCTNFEKAIQFPFKFFITCHTSTLNIYVVVFFCTLSCLYADVCTLQICSDFFWCFPFGAKKVLSICLSVCLLACLSFYLPVCQPVHPSIHLQFYANFSHLRSNDVFLIF